MKLFIFKDQPQFALVVIVKNRAIELNEP